MPLPKHRVVIVGLHYAPESTGNAPYTSSLAKGLKDLGYEIRVVTGYPHYPEWKIHKDYTDWSRHESVDGVPVQRLRHYVPSRPNFVNRLHMELSFGLRAAFAAWGQPDVLVVVSPALFASALVMLRARLFCRGLRIAVWTQDLYSRGLAETTSNNPFAKWLTKAMARLESLVLGSADGVIAIHERFKVHMIEQLEIDPGRIEVIRNWTHLPASPSLDRAAVREELGWAPGELIALHAGNIGKKQGLDNLVEAARLAESSDSRVRFILLGDGNQRPRLEELARGMKNITFIPPLPQEQFQRALAAADALVVNELPGLRDMSVPSKLTSYFNAAIPVVAATDENSVTAEEIERAQAGIRVDPASPGELLAAIEGLCSRPEAARSMGLRGLRFREDILSEDYAMARYDDFISTLASSRDR